MMDTEAIKSINLELSPYCLNLAAKPWESELLGKNILALAWNAPCDSIAEDQEDIWTQKLVWVQKELERFKPCLYIARIPALNYQASRALENAGFHLVECYLELDHSLDQVPSVTGENLIRPFVKDEIAKLEDIAKESFQYSRFHMDPQIPPDQAKLTRSEWVKNACLGRADVVLVAEVETQPVGFVIGMKKCLQEKMVGKLDLIAVHPDYRRRKLGYDLTVEFLNYCQEQKYSLVTVGTQAHNIPSLRMYEQTGFFMSQSFYTYHKHLA